MQIELSVGRNRSKIYAGCDTDFKAKLFLMAGETPIPVSHSNWCEVLKILGAEPGEMLEVSLSRASADVGATPII